MEKPGKFISLLFTLLIISGLGSSAFHLNNNLYDHSEDAHQEIVQDHNFCTLCASQFKFLSETIIEDEETLSFELFHFSLPGKFYADPVSNIQNSRAPPFLS